MELGLACAVYKVFLRTTSELLHALDRFHIIVGLKRGNLIIPFKNAIK